MDRFIVNRTERMADKVRETVTKSEPARTN